MEQQKYEICRKSKVKEMIQSGEEFQIVDLEKKRVYSSLDLRLRELAEKVDKDTTIIIKEAQYS